MLFADRLEVWNPGQLPPSLTPERLTRPHASIPRNPLIAEPLFLARYVEKAGTGTLDMIALSKNAGLKPPEFRQDGGQFVQTLWRPKQVTPQVTPQVKDLVTNYLDEFSQVLGLAAGQATPQAAAQAVVGLEVAREPVSREALQEAFDIKDREHFRTTFLEKFLSGGWLERTIPDKPTSPNQKYRLTDKGRAWLDLQRPKDSK
jgi:predicted HTH transcriptional regulator